MTASFFFHSFSALTLRWEWWGTSNQFLGQIKGKFATNVFCTVSQTVWARFSPNVPILQWVQLPVWNMLSENIRSVDQLNCNDFLIFEQRSRRGLQEALGTIAEHLAGEECVWQWVHPAAQTVYGRFQQPPNKRWRHFACHVCFVFKLMHVSLEMLWGVEL